MNRREFCQQLALLAAGAAALPAQLNSFNQLYEVNTRLFEGRRDILSIKSLVVGDVGAPHDDAYRIEIFNDATMLLAFAMNARATFAYHPAPDAPLLVTKGQLRWKVMSVVNEPQNLQLVWRYLDMDLRLHTEERWGTDLHL